MPPGAGASLDELAVYAFAQVYPGFCPPLVTKSAVQFTRHFTKQVVGLSGKNGKQWRSPA